MQTCKQDLRDQGFCVVRNRFDRPTLEKVGSLCDVALESATEKHRAMFKAQGSLIDVLDFPDFAEIIAHPVVIALLDELGLPGAVFCSGSVFSKPPGAPSLHWHQDWWGWDDVGSYTDRIGQVNVMTYLSETSPANGCLRVIPGSHRRHHPIHDRLPTDHQAMARVDDPDHPLYRSCDGEHAVPVRVGDIVVADTRLLHSTYANGSGEHRTMLSLCYNPNYAALPAEMRARIETIFRRDWGNGSSGLALAQWPEVQRKRIESLIPPGADGTVPLGFNFSPRPELLAKSI
ncbi:MAG TPA: phytanoyl-CoA dioxygenase family protein [Reyranella sp.]|nr:phytanoyl-CoA dioxygenase family protein [Reyranella sp.]